MGVAYFPLFERDVPGIDDPLEFGGKPLANAWAGLGAMAGGLGQPNLDTFVDHERALADLSDAAEDGGPDRGICWFHAAEAIPTVRALIDRLKNLPETLKLPRKSPFRPDEVLDDLVALESMLTSAAAANVRFRICVDL